MKNKNALLGALPIIATLLGQKLGVKVVIGGRQAFTDGQTIVLPSLPADGDPDLAVLANGYIDHEAAHIRYTDFSIAKPAGLAGVFTNVLEDVRIEQRLGERFPGSRHNLAALVDRLESQQSLLPPAEAPIAQQVSVALSALLRARLLGQTGLRAVADILETRLDKLLPSGVVTQLLALAFEVRKTASTAEVIALAQRIVARLEEEANPPAESRPQGGADAQSDADPQGDAGATPGDPRRAALATLLAAQGDEADGTDVGSRTARWLDRVGKTPHPVTVSRLDPVPVNRASQEAVAHARAATASLRRRLGALVESRQRDASWRSHRGRRLDLADLYRPAVGQSIRFVRWDERPAPNTALALLLDRSGSMNKRLSLAGQAVLSILLALDTLPGVASWAAAFPGSADDRIVPLKGFEEHTTRIAGRLTGLWSSGSTPLASALWRTGHELLQRPEPRRVVVVATDGEPDDLDGVNDILARCRASGIDVIGLGIGQSLDHVQAVFGVRHAAAIATLEALAPALFAVLERQLLA